MVKVEWTASQALGAELCLQDSSQATANQQKAVAERWLVALRLAATEVSISLGSLAAASRSVPAANRNGDLSSDGREPLLLRYSGATAGIANC